MKHISDAMVDAAVTPAMAQAALHDAFALLGAGRAAMQPRLRTECGGVKLSTLGAVIPDQGIAGAKVYTTIGGEFKFVILLFSTETGEALASFDAAAITRLRTAATSVIAARLLAKANSRVLGVIGAGAQGQEHIVQFALAYPLQEVRLNDPAWTLDRCEALARRIEVPVRACGAADAVEGADIVVTASRSTHPVVAGRSLAPGTFVAAIGSSLPHARELDDEALSRARVVAVEWKPQSLKEAGDLVLARPEVLDPDRIVELGDLLAGRLSVARDDDGIAIYKAVGVGLQDIALAGLVWRMFGAA